MATVLGRDVRVSMLDFVVVLCCDLAGFVVLDFAVLTIFSGILPRKYNVLGVSAIELNTSVKMCSWGDIWLILSKKLVNSVDILFLLCYNLVSWYPKRYHTAPK